MQLLSVGAGTRDSQVLEVDYEDVIAGVEDPGLESFELNRSIDRAELNTFTYLLVWRTVELRGTGGYPRNASPLCAGSIDSGCILKVLRKAGYDGGLTIEYKPITDFPQGQRLQITRKDIEYMRSVM